MKVEKYVSCMINQLKKKKNRNTRLSKLSNEKLTAWNFKSFKKNEKLSNKK